MAARTWTLEQRQRQREAIQRWKPWQLSTGPKTKIGKGTSSRNAFTGANAVMLRQVTKKLNAALLEQRKGIELLEI